MERQSFALNINTRKLISLILAVVILGSTIFLQVCIDGDHAQQGFASNGIDSGASTFFELLGGLRSVAAAYLWLKVDRIHDNYYRELSKKEDELIPLYRLVTWLNPHIDDAYYVGSYLLYLDKRPEEGWQFALEGLRTNPGSWTMEFNVGQLALLYKKDYKHSISHLNQAYALAQDNDEKVQVLQTLHAAYLRAGMIDRAKAVSKVLSAFLDHSLPERGSRY